MKVTKVEGSPDATYSEIDLELPEGTTEEVRMKIKRDVGDYLVEQVLKDVAGAHSPVSGERFPKLSKAYAKKKIAEGGTGIPDLTASGDMLGELDYRDADGDNIDVGIFGDKAWQADGHLKFSGLDNDTPKRRFLPDEGQHFAPEIEREVDKIIADGLVEGGAISPSLLEDVTSASELFDRLGSLFPGMTRREIRGAIMRSPLLSEMLDEMDLLDLLE